MTLMIADPPTSGMRLGVGFDAGRARTRTEAWKTTIGNQAGTARFALLPKAKALGSHGLSAMLQISLVTFFWWYAIFFRNELSN